ncbi:adrenocorticotropic hormone receptor-like [Lingula anatina]|uniref:Adrenocorticotropic hormone receptor-like n=1 Tax=Lingula anatina TaxID=7574 RepID=A0A1S3JYK0_LINAN|nr:adrenocorticotropic hormone receptor-like [Lingula anatina]|eukprot:XP_013415500.1 adrenocorticotropic hormone receptor-like [Lingula anatina]
MRRPFQPLQILITHLAATDLLVLVLALMTSLTVVHIKNSSDPEDKSTFMCVVDVIQDLLMCGVQLPLVNTTFILINQILALTYPLRYKILVGTRVVKIILSVSYAFVAVTYVAFHVAKLATTSQENCSKYFANDYSVASLWYLAVTCTTMCLLNLILNGVLFVKARAIIGNTGVSRQRTTDEIDTGTTHSDRKLVVTVIWLSGTVVIFWTPLAITFGLRAYITEKEFLTSNEMAVAHVVTGTLGMVNGLCDPLLYGVRLPEVRDGYKKLWSKIRNAVGSGTVRQRQSQTVETLSTSL